MLNKWTRKISIILVFMFLTVTIATVDIRNNTRVYADSSTPTAITNMYVYDSANASDWSVRTNIQQNDQQYGDQTYTMTMLSTIITGLEWIRPANDSKAYTGNTLAEFTVPRDSYVYIAHDDRIATKPSWMSTWVDTGEHITNSESISIVYSLYRKFYTAGSVVSLGNNGNTTYNTYLIIVDSAKKQTGMKENLVLTINDCDSTSGWQGGSGGNPVVDTTDKKEGAGSLSESVTGTQQALFKKVLTTPIDLKVDNTNGALRFWLYTSDAQVLSGSSQLELTSSGTNDQNEMYWNLAALGIPLQTGWNLVTLKFADAGYTGGTPNLAAINFIRFYANNRPVPDVTVKIDNIQIIDLGYIIIDDCDSNTDWLGGSGGNPVVDTSEKKEGAGSLSESVTGTQQALFKKVLTTPIDLKVDKTNGVLKFWLYTSDAQVLNGSSQLELTSSGTNDQNELYWNLSALGISLQTGWNLITLKFADAGYAGGTPNLGAINFIRFYAINRPVPDVTVKIDNIQIMDLGYIIIDDCDSTTGWVGGSGGNPVVDTSEKKEGTGSLSESVTSTQIVLFQKVFTDPININTDKTNGTLENGALRFWLYTSDIHILDGNTQLELTSSGQSDKKEINWDLAALDIPLQVGWNLITLKFSECSKSGGGADLGAINFIRFYALTIPSSNVTVKIDDIKVVDIIIDGCNSEEGWQGGSGGNPVIDYDERREGIGSLSETVTGTQQVLFQKVLPTPVDLKVDAINGALRFWLYTSSTQVLDGSSQIELTSSGQYDQNEINWTLSAMDIPLQVGWNLITLDFADAGYAGGTPNLGAINFIRFYAINRPVPNVTVKIDDIQIIDKSYIDNFEYNRDVTLGQAWTVYSGTPGAQALRNPVYKSGGDYSLMFKYDLSSINYNTLEYFPTETLDWTGQEGLQFWVLPDASRGKLRVTFTQGVSSEPSTYAVWYCDVLQPYHDVLMDYPYAVFTRAPFNTFSRLEGTADMDLSKVNKIGLTIHSMPSGASNTGTIAIDDLKLYNDNWSGHPIAKTQYTDPVSGKTINKIKRENCDIGTPYFTSSSWSSDGSKLEVISVAPGENPNKNLQKEELLNISNLSSNFLTNNYILRYLGIMSSDNKYYYGKGNKLYSVDTLNNFAETLVCSITNKRNLGEPFSISNDGTAMGLYWISANDGEYTIGKVDLESKSYTEIIKPDFAEPSAEANHAQINPYYKDKIFYSHGNVTAIPDRIWVVDVNTLVADNVYEQEYLPDGTLGEYVGHETWSHDGAWLYFVKYSSSPLTPAGIMRVDRFGNNSQTINSDYSYWHVATSPDNNWVVADTTPSGGKCKIILINTTTGTSQVLAEIKYRNTHPGHPHPFFSPDSNKVTFNFEDDSGDLCVGYVEID